MKYTLFAYCIFSLSLIAVPNPQLVGNNTPAQPQHVADWLIVGAGPAGILTIGVLLDIGVRQESIIWLDPEFNVGRMGAFYQRVFANSRVQEFIDFVSTCTTFQNCSCAELDYLKTLDPNERGYELGVIVRPLQQITNYLKARIHAVQDSMDALYFDNNTWHVNTKGGQELSAHHVILATGSYPKELPYEKDKTIPLDSALDRFILPTLVTPNDRVAVVGSSHSAILLLKFLSELEKPVDHIYNFYRTPLKFVAEKSNPLLSKTTELKGVAAEWAQNVLEINPPANLTRIYTPTDQDIAAGLTNTRCTKVIYAIGYERNDLPSINGATPIVSYNEANGLIAPRLFGIGVAFPEKITDSQGNQKYCIGFDCFMDYAHKIIPQWVSSDQFKDIRMQQAHIQLQRLKKWSNFFTVSTL